MTVKIKKRSKKQNRNNNSLLHSIFDIIIIHMFALLGRTAPISNERRKINTEPGMWLCAGFISILLFFCVGFVIVFLLFILSSCFYFSYLDVALVGWICGADSFNCCLKWKIAYCTQEQQLTSVQPRKKKCQWAMSMHTTVTTIQNVKSRLIIMSHKNFKCPLPKISKLLIFYFY